MFRGRRNTATTRDFQAEKFSIWESSRGGGWGSNSLSFSHAESRNSHFTGGFARRFFAAIAATLLVVGVVAGTVAGIGVTTASAATPLSVTTTSPLPLAPLNTPYSVTLAATGGTGSYTWSVATGSTLPSWLSLDSTTGVLSGTPTTDATATFAVTVTDSASPADTATSGQLTLYAGNGGTRTVLAQHDLGILDGAVSSARGLAALPAPDHHHAHWHGCPADRCHHRCNVELACSGRRVQRRCWGMYQLPHG